MKAGDPITKATVHFSGDVQGVNFRERTRRTAQDFEVGGFVQNLPDGRVLLVAEGDQGEVERFLSRVEEKMGALIAHTEKSEETASTPQYDEFSIRW